MRPKPVEVSTADLNNLIKLAFLTAALLISIGEAEAKSMMVSRTTVHTNSKSLLQNTIQKRNHSRSHQVATKPPGRLTEEQCIVIAKPESAHGVYEFMFSSGVMTVTDLTTTGGTTSE